MIVDTNRVLERNEELEQKNREAQVKAKTEDKRKGKKYFGQLSKENFKEIMPRGKGLVAKGIMVVKGLIRMGAPSMGRRDIRRRIACSLGNRPMGTVAKVMVRTRTRGVVIIVKDFRINSSVNIHCHLRGNASNLLCRASGILDAVGDNPNSGTSAIMIGFYSGSVGSS